MSAAGPLVTVARGVERIITVKQGASTVEVRQVLSPRVSVVTVGVQGPVGALAENILQRTLQAERDASKALSLAEGADSKLASLLEGLQGAFTYHAGVISAQGGS